MGLPHGAYMGMADLTRSLGEFLQTANAFLGGSRHS